MTGVLFLGMQSLWAGGTPDAGKSVTLRYSTWDYADRRASTDAFIAGAKEKLNITIELENYPTDQYENMVKTKVSSGDAPDLINVHGVISGYGMELAGAGAFLDTSDIAARRSFVPSALEAGQLDGRHYFVSVTTNVLGVLYNKAVFAKLGIVVPRDIDAFTAACGKIRSAGIVPIAGGFKDSWTTQIIPFIAIEQYLEYGLSNADGLKKLADGRISYSDPRFRKALAVQNDWATKGYFPDSFLGSDINVASAMVGTGTAAMLVNGTWQYSAVQSADPSAQIGFFALPLNAKGEKVMVPTAPGGGICISATSKNPPAAKRALEYYLSEEIQGQVVADVKGITTNRYMKVSDPFLAEVNAALVSNSPTPYWHGFFTPQVINTELEKGFQGMLAQAVTMDALIESVNKLVGDRQAGR
jgi:raffinose/stachyose/melibiose transport system substrate-binding protein